MATWNPWHGCRKISPGCQNCYVYRIDAEHDRDASALTRNRDFDLPVRRARSGEFKIPPGETVYTCFTSDFLLEGADEWRAEAWEMIRERRDLDFFMITKRIERLGACLPDGWGEGFENVTICCTAENQEMADHRLPVLRAAPIRHKVIVCEPLIGPIDLSAHLGDWVEEVIAGGESGARGRVCDFEWVVALRESCVRAGVPFAFKQTGAHFKKGGRVYDVPRKLQHAQAKKAGIDWRPRGA